MKRISGGLGTLVSFAVGAAIAGGVLHYEYQSPAPATTTVNTVGDTSTPTPTYDMTPPGVEVTPTVEGDDGSLGGPVYDQNHQNVAKPNYVTPEDGPTSENANDADTTTSTPAASGTSEATAPAKEARPEAPAPTVTPSHDDHATEAPSGDPTAESR